MVADDGQGVQRGYLANEELYQALRDMHERNLIVPLVGDFAGPKALRSVARYLDLHHATVSVFYTSNVEQYLFRPPTDALAAVLRQRRRAADRRAAARSSARSSTTRDASCGIPSPDPQIGVDRRQPGPARDRRRC